METFNIKDVLKGFQYLIGSIRSKAVFLKAIYLTILYPSLNIRIIRCTPEPYIVGGLKPISRKRPPAPSSFPSMMCRVYHRLVLENGRREVQLKTTLLKEENILV